MPSPNLQPLERDHEEIIPTRPRGRLADELFRDGGESREERTALMSRSQLPPSTKASPWRILKNKPDCLISKPRTGYCLSPASYSRRFSQQSSVCNFRAADGDGLAISPARSLLDCLLPIEPTSAFAFLSFDCPEWGASLLFPSISPSWRGSRGTAPMTVCRGRLAVIALLGDSAVTF